MKHVCNPWCIDNLHAIFFDTMPSERSGVSLGPVAQRLAYNAGLTYLGFSEVRPEKVEVDGTRHALGATRGRVVIWCAEGQGAYPTPPAERG